jgi:hypothetical protein
MLLAVVLVLVKTLLQKLVVLVVLEAELAINLHLVEELLGKVMMADHIAVLLVERVAEVERVPLE